MWEALLLPESCLTLKSRDVTNCHTPLLQYPVKDQIEYSTHEKISKNQDMLKYK